VFAYALGTTGDELTARDVAVAAFASVFALPDMREPEFEVQVFKAARDAARPASKRGRHFRDGLSPREREVISLVFDARLSRDQVAGLLSLRPETVLGMLLKGLRKLRDPFLDAAPRPLPSFS
jgi:hypothetical protein